VPGGLAFDADGEILIAGGYDNSVLRVSRDGLLKRLAGSGGYSGPIGDGGPATSARLSAPFGIAAEPDGSYYIADTFAGRIRRVSPHGIIETIAGDPNGSSLVEGVHPEEIYIGFAEKVSIGPDRRIYVADTWDSQILVIGDTGAIRREGEYWIPSAEGSAVFIFDESGEHLRTVNALTGATMLSFSYDPEGKITSIVDYAGNATTVARDASGRPLAIVGPFGQVTALELDDVGRLASVSNEAGEAHRMEYLGASSLLTRFIDPKQSSTAIDYWPESIKLIRETNRGGGWTTIGKSADRDGQSRVAVRTAMGSTTLFERRLDTESETEWTTERISAADQVISTSVRNRNGVEESRQADGTLRTRSEYADPVWGSLVRTPHTISLSTPSGLGPETEVIHLAALSDPHNPLSLAERTTEIRVNGQLYRAHFDRTQLLWTFTSPAGRISHIQIDEAGRPVATQVGDLEPVFYGYDNRGRLDSLLQGSGLEERRVDFSYDALGRLRSVQDPLLRQVSFSYDDSNRVVAQELPGNRTVHFDWDPNGNLISLTPPGKPAHLFTHTPADLPATYEPPDIGIGPVTTDYEWNLDLNPDRIVRPDSTAIEIGYDAGQRPISITSPRGSQTIQWEPNTGRIQRLTTPEGVALDYLYDGPLVTRTTWSGAGISGRVDRTYDDDLRLKTISVNGAQPITYAYDADSLVKQAGSLVLHRDPQTALLTGTTLGNITTSYTYNGFGELTAMAAHHGATPLYAEDYTRDSLGRIVTRVETIQSVTTTYDYSYDQAGRLKTVSQNGDPSAQYAYDDNGNRLSKWTPATTETGSYDDQDRMLSYAGATYGYTANGATLTKTDNDGTTTYDYDAFGNLLGVDLPNGTQIHYRFDARNRRIERGVNGTVTQRLLWQSQLAPIAELDASNAVVTRFVYATRVNVPDYMIRGGATYRILSDHLGSPRLIVNATTGAIAQRMDFDEWGRLALATNPSLHPFGFGGGLLDRSVARTRFGARDYSAGIGRWASQDPLRFHSGDTNAYAFVLNDPIGLSDPLGLASICYRPLKRTPIVIYDRNLDQVNNVVGHEHIWFEDDENVGFGPHGRFKEQPEKRKKYSRCREGYDDDLLRIAISNVPVSEDGSYEFFVNNCQHWVDRVLVEYRRLQILEAQQ
jgi:RHS repeat-associated protein